MTKRKKTDVKKNLTVVIYRTALMIKRVVPSVHSRLYVPQATGRWGRVFRQLARLLARAVACRQRGRTANEVAAAPLV